MQVETVAQIKDKLDNAKEGTGVQIVGLRDHYAFKFSHGPRRGYWIGVHREHGSWPLTTANLELAKVNALHAPTRIQV